MDLDVLTQALDHLGGVDPSVFADTDSIELLHRQLARLEALVTGATAAFDAAGNWMPEGARNATGWLTARCRVTRAQARREVRRGRELRHLPATAGAWADGRITGPHVDVLADLRCGTTEETLARDEPMLVDQATRLRFDQFVRATAYWMQRADPNGGDEAAEKRRARRDVSLASSFQGMWLGAMTLDPVSGSIVAGELHRLERRLFDLDWSGAKEALGRDPRLSELARTSAQRRADALVEMATRSETAPGNGRRPAPLFTVLVGYETLHGRISELEDGTVVPPGSLLPWLPGADIERAEFTPGGRIEIGAPSTLSSVSVAGLDRAVSTPVTRAEIPPTRRLFTGATRRAVEVRDRACTHPLCDVPAPGCQVDHIQPWALGGPTTQENGRLLCGPHNRMRNQNQRPPPDG